MNLNNLIFQAGVLSVILNDASKKLDKFNRELAAIQDAQNTPSNPESNPKAIASKSSGKRIMKPHKKKTYGGVKGRKVKQLPNAMNPYTAKEKLQIVRAIDKSGRLTTEAAERLAKAMKRSPDAIKTQAYLLKDTNQTEKVLENA